MKQDVKKEQEEKKRLLWMFIKLVVMGLVLLFLLFTLLKEGIAWFASSTDATAGGMGIEVEDSGFEIQVNGTGSIEFDDLYQFLDSRLTGNSGTVTNRSAGGQVISWRMDEGDDELQPGSQGELHFSVTSTGADLTQLKYRLDLSAYDAITHVNSTTDQQGNTVETVELDDLVEITAENEYSGDELDAVDYLNGHILFFTGRNGNSPSNYQYYGFIDDNDDFELTLDNGAGTIYWIWPNTLGQITLLATDTGYISGTPVLYANATSYTTDRANLTTYLKSNASVVFAGNANFSSLIDSLYSKRTAGTSYLTEFDALSEGYNSADQTIGRNVDYVLMQMIVDTN